MKGHLIPEFCFVVDENQSSAVFNKIILIQLLSYTLCRGFYRVPIIAHTRVCVCVCGGGGKVV